jgi:cephalosporin hydroxylase
MAEAKGLPIVQKRVEFLIASSTAPETIARVAAQARGKRVLVILDSDHSKGHVLDELRAYAPLVQPGGYLIVQDSNVNGHPALPTFGPGPMEAIDEFMAGNTEFVIDRSRERLLFTFSPRGFLKRVN